MTWIAYPRVVYATCLPVYQALLAITPSLVPLVPREESLSLKQAALMGCIVNAFMQGPNLGIVGSLAWSCHHNFRLKHV